MPILSADTIILPPSASLDTAFQTSVTLPTPAAGTSLTYTTKGDFYEVVVSAVCTFTTSATVATRVVLVRINDSNGNEVAQVSPSGSQAASLSFGYTNLLSVSTPTFDGSVAHLGPLPAVALFPGWQFQFLVSNIQAGDAITNASLIIQRFPTHAMSSVTPLVLAPTPLAV